VTPDFRLIARKENKETERKSNADRQALAIPCQTEHAGLVRLAKFLQLSGRLIKVKTLRQISAATFLSLTLAVSVMAGQVDSPASPAPAPSSTTTQASSTATSILLTVLSLIYR
jgi:hypothetical protein